jgi:hypothetical protein
MRMFSLIEISRFKHIQSIWINPYVASFVGVNEGVVYVVIVDPEIIYAFIKMDFAHGRFSREKA